MSFSDGEESLEVLFSELEIKEVVWSYKGSMNPGPDEFNFFFIKKFWDF